MREDAGAEQGLADIDVAEAGDDRLVEQRRLDRGFPAREGVREGGGRKGIVERFGAEAGDQAVGVLRRGRDEIERAEAAGIDEADEGAIVGFEGQVLVRQRGGIDRHPAGHAEMDQHRQRAVEPHEHVFATAAEAFDAGAGEELHEALGDRPAQVGPGEDDPGEAAAFELGGEAAHHGFDFGEFRHGAFAAIA